MGATRLRGFGWAGLRLALEAPASWRWDWPEHLRDRICSPDDPDVRVRVHPLRAQPAIADGVALSHEGESFDSGRHAGAHTVQVHRDRRVARLAADGRECHVWLPPSAIRSRVFPLARPLDDLVLLHRALRQGRLAVRGTAAVRSGRALVVLGDAPSRAAVGRTALWRGWLLIDPRGDRARVAPLPSTARTSAAPRLGATVEGLHLLESGPSGVPVAVLDPELAAAEILRFAFVPLSGWQGCERALESATQLARGVRIMRLRAAAGARFGWRQARSKLSAAPPAGA